MSPPKVERGKPLELPAGYDAELEGAIPDGAGWRPWTAADEAKLRRYYPQGVPVSALMERLGRTRASVEKKIDRLGLRRAPRGKGD